MSTTLNSHLRPSNHAWNIIFYIKLYLPHNLSSNEKNHMHSDFTRKINAVSNTGLKPLELWELGKVWRRQIENKNGMSGDQSQCSRALRRPKCWQRGEQQELCMHEASHKGSQKKLEASMLCHNKKKKCVFSVGHWHSVGNGQALRWWTRSHQRKLLRQQSIWTAAWGGCFCFCKF